MEAAIRKYQSDLMTGGNGVILFGLWSIIKVIMTYTLTDTTNLYINEDLPEYVMAAIYFVVFFVVLYLIGLLHVYVGLCAISEGTGMKSGKLYIVLSILMAVADLCDIFIAFTTKDAIVKNYSLFVSALVDITASAMYLQIAYAAIRIRRLTLDRQRKSEVS